MERYNTATLFEAGAALNPLTRLAQPTDLLMLKHAGGVIAAYICLTKMKVAPRLYVMASDGWLRRASQLAKTLKGTLQEGWPTNSDEVGPAALEIRRQAIDLCAIINSECEGVDLFYFPDVQAYKTRTLLESGETIVKPMDEKLRLYDGPLADTRQATKCLAMELWTAMGFHIARATEGLIQEYYVQEYQSLPVAGGQRTWGSMVRKLEAEKKGDPGLLKSLAFVCSEHRNPLIHPEESLDDINGPMLLSACTGVMVKLLNALDAE